MYPNCTHMSYDKIFARNVKARREAMGYTRKELAEAQMGYPEELLARVEEGNTTGCTIDFLVCLAEYLETPLEALMTDRYFYAAQKQHLYLVVAGYVEASTVEPHHSLKIIATSENEAKDKAIERDKNYGMYNDKLRYFAYLQPGASNERAR